MNGQFTEEETQNPPPTKKMKKRKKMYSQPLSNQGNVN